MPGLFHSCAVSQLTCLHWITFPFTPHPNWGFLSCWIDANTFGWQYHLPTLIARSDLWVLLLSSNSFCQPLPPSALQIKWGNFTWHQWGLLILLWFTFQSSLVTHSKRKPLIIYVFLCSHVYTLLLPWLTSQTCPQYPKEALYHVKLPLPPQLIQRMLPPPLCLALPGGLCFSGQIPE